MFCKNVNIIIEDVKMKQITTSQANTNRDFHGFTKQEKEAKKLFIKYHPMENNPSFKVDDEYKRKVKALFGEV